MSLKRIRDYSAILGAGTAAGDTFLLWNIAGGAHKSITRAELVAAIAAQGVAGSLSIGGTLAVGGTVTVGGPFLAGYNGVIQHQFRQGNDSGILIYSDAANEVVLDAGKVSDNYITKYLLNLNKYGGGVRVGSLNLASLVTLVGQADGVLKLTNNAGTGFTRLQLGGTTSSFPVFGISGSNFQFILADGSAYTEVQCQNVLLNTGGKFYFASGARLKSAADGIIALFDSTEATFGRLQFGGTTASFPAFKRSSAALQSRLADDSAFADFGAASLITNSSTIFFGANGTLVATADGVYKLANNAGTSFDRLQFGGSTSAFPALKRSAAALALRLADDSADAALTVSSLLASGATAGIGYSTGAGGTVAQATSKATGVTLNKLCGTITMNGAALASATSVAFTLTDSAIAATDFVEVQHDSVGTLGGYGITATPAAGSATITVRNNTAGSLSEAIVLRFLVTKAVTS